jgi:multiple RNA-binding domain-containing protein 1
MNQDAVANLMAKKYNINKSDIFDVHSSGTRSGSIAVKLSIGETQLVNDMRKFLQRNGVKLDAFAANNNSTERSKTTILLKNLPNNTSEDDLKKTFERYKVDLKTIKRFVLPEYGVAALIEFNERQEARDAFRKLAYKKFKSLPLYLEWAPEDIFHSDIDIEKMKLEEKDEKTNNKTVK